MGKNVMKISSRNVRTSIIIIFIYKYEITACFSPCVQNAAKNPVKVPPPVPSKPRQVNLPFPGAGTFPGKGKASSQQQRTPLPPAQSNTLPLPSKQETPPAATVRPFTPEPKEPPMQKPQTVAASSIYSMYTKQSITGKGLQQGVQGVLNRSQNRSNFVSSE